MENKPITSRDELKVKTIDKFIFEEDKLFFDGKPLSVLKPHGLRDKPILVQVTNNPEGPRFSYDWIRIGTGQCCNGYVLEFQIKPGENSQPELSQITSLDLCARYILPLQGKASYIVAGQGCNGFGARIVSLGPRVSDLVSTEEFHSIMKKYPTTRKDYCLNLDSLQKKIFFEIFPLLNPGVLESIDLTPRLLEQGVDLEKTFEMQFKHREIANPKFEWCHY